MHFYKEDGLQVTKYIMAVSEMELQNLRQLVIKDCSVIAEKCVERTEPPKTSDPDQIFGIIRGEFVRLHDEQQGPTREVYKYYYKERQYSKMVEWIDALLKGDVTILERIYAGKPEDKESGLHTELKRLLEESSKISDSDYDKKIAILNKIKDVSRKIEINERVKPEFYYYDILLSTLQPEPLAVISKDEFNRVLNFLGKSPKELGMVFINNVPALGEIKPEGIKKI